MVLFMAVPGVYDFEGLGWDRFHRLANYLIGSVGVRRLTGLGRQSVAQTNYSSTLTQTLLSFIIPSAVVDWFHVPIC